MKNGTVELHSPVKKLGQDSEELMESDSISFDSVEHKMAVCNSNKSYMLFDRNQTAASSSITLSPSRPYRNEMTQ